MASHDWHPTSHDKTVLDYWFNTIDRESVGSIGGTRVANFLKPTNLSRDILRVIWQIVDITNSGTINKNQFYKLIRIVSVCMHTPLPKGYPSQKLYESTLYDTFPIPSLSVNKDIIDSSPQATPSGMPPYITHSGPTGPLMASNPYSHQTQIPTGYVGPSVRQQYTMPSGEPRTLAPLPAISTTYHSQQFLQQGSQLAQPQQSNPVAALQPQIPLPVSMSGQYNGTFANHRVPVVYPSAQPVYMSQLSSQNVHGYVQQISPQKPQQPQIIQPFHSVGQTYPSAPVPVQITSTQFQPTFGNQYLRHMNPATLQRAPLQCDSNEEEFTEFESATQPTTQDAVVPTTNESMEASLQDEFSDFETAHVVTDTTATTTIQFRTDQTTTASTTPQLARQTKGAIPSTVDLMRNLTSLENLSKPGGVTSDGTAITNAAHTSAFHDSNLRSVASESSSAALSNLGVADSPLVIPTNAASNQKVIPTPVVSDRMHILDELIEADLRVEQEQWDEFTDSTTVPVSEPAPTSQLKASSPTLPLQQLNPFDHFINSHSQFNLSYQDTITPIRTEPTLSAASTVNVSAGLIFLQQSVPLVSDCVNTTNLTTCSDAVLDDEFGDFEEALSSPRTKPPETHVSYDDEQERSNVSAIVYSSSFNTPTFDLSDFKVASSKSIGETSHVQSSYNNHDIEQQLEGIDDEEEKEAIRVAILMSLEVPETATIDSHGVGISAPVSRGDNGADDIVEDFGDFESLQLQEQVSEKTSKYIVSTDHTVESQQLEHLPGTPRLTNQDVKTASLSIPTIPLVSSFSKIDISNAFCFDDEIEDAPLPGLLDTTTIKQLASHEEQKAFSALPIAPDSLALTTAPTHLSHQVSIPITVPVGGIQWDDEVTDDFGEFVDFVGPPSETIAIATNFEIESSNLDNEISIDFKLDPLQAENVGNSFTTFSADPFQDEDIDFGDFIAPAYLSVHHDKYSDETSSEILKQDDDTGFGNNAAFTFSPEATDIEFRSPIKVNDDDFDDFEFVQATQDTSSTLVPVSQANFTVPVYPATCVVDNDKFTTGDSSIHAPNAVDISMTSSDQIHENYPETLDDFTARITDDCIDEVLAELSVNFENCKYYSHQDLKSRPNMIKSKIQSSAAKNHEVSESSSVNSGTLQCVVLAPTNISTADHLFGECEHFEAFQPASSDILAISTADIAVSVATSTIVEFNHQNGNDVDSEDEFGDFTNANYESVNTIPSSELVRPTSIYDRPSKTTETIPERALRHSPQEFDLLAVALFDRNMYDESYCCCIQSKKAARISNLNEKLETMTGISPNDITSILKLHREVEIETSQLAPEDEVARWLTLTWQQPDSKLEAIVDAIERVSAVMARKCKIRHLDCLPSTSSQIPFIDRVKAHLVAKRCFQLILTLVTTHLHYPDYWKTVLQYVEHEVSNAITKLNVFESMSMAEQQTLLETEKLKEYVVGVFDLCQIGMQTASSCLLAMVREALASSVVQCIYTYMKSMRKSSWNLLCKECSNGHVSSSSPLLAHYPTFEELREASLVIPWSQAVHCNLSLHSLGYKAGHTTDPVGDHDHFSTTTHSSISHWNGITYFQPAINLWLHELATPRFTPPLFDSPIE